MELTTLSDRAAPPSGFPYILDLVGRAERCVDSNPSLTKRYLTEITSFLARGIGDGIEALLVPSMPDRPSDSLAKGGLAAWQIRRVGEHVDDHLERTILIEDLAAVTRLSPGHFCRAFKVSTGDTPHEFIIRQRIRRAQRLMLTTEDNLSQIACACGLTDQAHLTRLFRRLLHTTPLLWRRTCRTA